MRALCLAFRLSISGVPPDMAQRGVQTALGYLRKHFKAIRSLCDQQRKR